MPLNRLRDVFAEQLRSKRQEAKLSQLALATAASMDRKTVNRIEHGTSPVALDQLEALADALDIAPAELLRE